MQGASVKKKFKQRYFKVAQTGQKTNGEWPRRGRAVPTGNAVAESPKVYLNDRGLKPMSGAADQWRAVV